MRSNLLYLSYIPPREMRDVRETLHCWVSLISDMDGDICELASEDPRAMLLTTIPGISYFSALLIVCEIGDISRFATAYKLCSCTGLVPRVHSSGRVARYGPITKQGSRYLRWIMVGLSHRFSLRSFHNV